MSITFNNVSQSIDVTQYNCLTEHIYQNQNGEWMLKVTSNDENIEYDPTPMEIKNFEQCVRNMLTDTYESNQR